MPKSKNISSAQSVTMTDLTDRQAAFVREYVERGGKAGAAADAAVAAGYAQPGAAGRGAARVRAFELLRNTNVLQVLRDELTRKLSAGAALGVHTLIDLCQNARSEQVRLSAANSLIDRGFGPVMSRNATLHASTTVEDFLDMLDSQNAKSQPRE
jgi:phage terminase small subunit